MCTVSAVTPMVFFWFSSLHSTPFFLCEYKCTGAYSATPKRCALHCDAHWCACNTLQHTATRCNTLQHTATHCNTLLHTATHCYALQRTAMHCNALQCTATHCNALPPLQRTAMHCYTLQRTATHTAAHRRHSCAPQGSQDTVCVLVFVRERETMCVCPLDDPKTQCVCVYLWERERLCVCVSLKRSQDTVCVCVFVRKRERMCVCVPWTHTHTHTHQEVRTRKLMYDSPYFHSMHRQVFQRINTKWQ